MKQKAALEKHYAEGENLFLKTLNCIGCFLITGKTSCSSIQLGIIIEQLQGYLLYTLIISNPPHTFNFIPQRTQARRYRNFFCNVISRKMHFQFYDAIFFIFPLTLIFYYFPPQPYRFLCLMNQDLSFIRKNRCISNALLVYLI